VTLSSAPTTPSWLATRWPMWIWTVGTLLLACALVVLGLAWGSLAYGFFAFGCAVCGTLLFLIAGLLWLVARRWVIPRRIAQVWASAGLAGVFQVVPAIPVNMFLADYEVRIAKADCEQVIPVIEAWKSDHGEYPADIAELMPHSLIGTSWGHTSISTRGGAGFYCRCAEGYTIAIPDPWSFDNDIRFFSWKNPPWTR
jgi:hypothetical protein